MKDQEEQIITSAMDTDFYKVTMQKGVFHQYPKTQVEYTFTCRDKGVKLGFLAEKVNRQVKMMENLKLTEKEENFLRSIRFMTSDYIDFLKNFRFDSNRVKAIDHDGNLEITISGLWLDTILYEVPLLAIVSELYFRETSNFEELKQEGINRLNKKIELINQYRLPLVDMGTRRRYSAEWQDYVVGRLASECESFIGTSNVYLAMKYNIKAIGTQAHEWFMAHLGLVDNIREAQKRALYVWLQEYGTDLGIALTDTFTTKAFFKDFDLTLSTTFSGMRCDSGDDPVFFGNEAIDHYKGFNINPRTKDLIFSDSLNIPKAIAIFLQLIQKIKTSYGIGTDLMNDLSIKALNIVIKLSMSNGVWVTKLSDSPGKTMGNLELAKEIKRLYDIQD